MIGIPGFSSRLFASLANAQINVILITQGSSEHSICVGVDVASAARAKEAVDKTFEYAKKCGVNMIVGVPNYDLIEYAEQKVKEYDIKLAIHNHGPEDALYPAPGDVYNRVKNLDARMGMCIDIGHSLRAGTLPEKAIRDFKDRLFDLHIKDINTAAKEGKGIEFGRGVINFGAVIESLRKVKYTGICSIEYEKDMSDPLPGIAESVGYFKGRMAAEN